MSAGVDRGGAFAPYTERHGDFQQHEGAYLLDVFAGQAMQALLLRPDCVHELPDDLADAAYRTAGAMLRARNRVTA